MIDNKQDLCCDISDMANPMCWGCYVVWYEREKEKWDWANEEFFRDIEEDLQESQEALKQEANI